MREARGESSGRDSPQPAPVLYVLMARQLLGMWRHVQAGLDLRAILTDILFLLILVEIFRLLIYYLRERHVAVGTMVEVGIIGIPREMILNGPWRSPGRSSWR